MNTVVIYIALVLVGLCLGSFSGATVWRLRARQLRQDRADGEKIDKKEYARLQELTNHGVRDDRSCCLHCHHGLAWYDLIPLISWLSLRGKCRYCGVSIGFFEPSIEIAVAAFFVLSYLLWPVSVVGSVEVVRFIVWLLAGTGLAILFSYDLKWFLLPDRVTFPVIGLGATFAILTVLQSSSLGASLLSVGGQL